MSIAFLDEQITKRDRTRTAGPQSHSAQASRRGPARVVSRRPLVSLSQSVTTATAVAPVRVLPVSLVTAPVAGPSVRPARLRLTPRGRLVFGVVLVGLALLVFSLGRFSAGAEASGPPLRVTVQSGDTLWSIAGHAARAADPRVEVARIIAVNHLADSTALTPGSVLLVPRG